LPAPRNQVLRARVGIATGPVVVGDVTGEDLAREVNVVGETPNLAARLLSAGQPDSVIIAGSTRRLIGNLYILKALEPQFLKGIAEPVLAFRVVSEQQGLSRFEATRGTVQGTPFVGRAQEVGLLLDRWEQARGGDGQLVLISGEAGIGKSRITETLSQAVTQDAHHRLRYQCTPQHTNSPLFPVITQLVSAIGLASAGDESTRLARLRDATPDLTDEQLMLLANLLGVPFPPGSELHNLTPARKRTLLLDGLATHVTAQCKDRPVLWVVEDAHWIDPTTEELISRVIDRAMSLRLLVVITHRLDYAPPWSSHPAATQLPLARLSRGNTNALLEGLGGNRTIPPAVLDYISSRADGVPLFMEELFQALRDSGTLSESGLGYELARPLDGTEIPATLQDSLMARLDRLAPAKSVAQLGAAIGREFDHALLQAISGMQPDALAEGLRQLQSAGLVLSRGAQSDATYIFKHALIQDAAYGSMLRQPRQEVHGRIAAMLIERTQDPRPELIAHHLEAAARTLEAASWLEKAGDRAASESANQEAIRSWRRALTQLPEHSSPDMERSRIQLMQKLSGALLQSEGYGSPAAFELGEATLAAASRLDDTDLYIRVCTSKSPTLFSRLDFPRIEQELARISASALANADVTTRVHFLGIRSVVHQHLGRFALAMSDLQDILTSVPESIEHNSSFGGGDIRFVARSYLSRVRIHMGLLDGALEMAEQALTKARQIGQPFSIAWGAATLGRTQCMFGRFDAALTSLDESIAISERYGYLSRLGQALAIRATAAAGRGAFDEAVNSLDRGVDLWRRSAGDFSLDWLLLDPAHMFLERRRDDLARSSIRLAGDIYAATPERGSYAEVLRMDGLLKAIDGDDAAARARLREAIDVATHQEAGLFRLRASYALAELLIRNGEAKEAHEILAVAYGSMTEGFGAPDLVKAKALLNSLEA
jgi:tetratricopeptide (TPR) repeat protein